MGNTVFTNALSVVHKSSHPGASIKSFPDVCTTPGPGAPVPLPYPNVARSAQQNTAASKNTAPGKNPPAYRTNTGDEAGSNQGLISQTNMEKVAFKQARGHQLRAQLHSLHTQMANLPPGNPTRWHRLLDDYVVLSAELYKTLTD